ncbi:trypsin-like peptidase domain-containing protein [Hoyosella sp. YIM 151337]|uniref:S1C family serine protease n=1 Tax=Hoyosella sp. YIM 151337 TaxID=2992742 RepID=UPI0022363988|nr:trypsin-like peptidase domain-containing protein [Hoyosella sp. YIM 151337]MCW4352071.1 trypsin-like peptidase domain-containing protein [Hoyosella sp. YIM 151337]
MSNEQYPREPRPEEPAAAGSGDTQRFPAYDAHPDAGQPGGLGVPPHGHGLGAHGQYQHAPYPQGPLYPPAETGQPQKRGTSRTGFIAGALVLALLSAGIGGAVGGYVASQDSNSAPPAVSAPVSSGGGEAAPEGSVQWAAERIIPSVVMIDVRTQRASGSGSGVILSSDGLILTNNHVVAPSDGTVEVSFYDGTTATGRVVAGDVSTDIAVVQVEGRTDLVPATIGSSSDLRVGQDVVAVGSPLGLDGTVTSGIVSALHRPVSATGETGQDGTTSYTVIDAIQTDAAINPGNSGGALVNMNGELVGINTAIATLGSMPGLNPGSIGLGFSIPIDQARRIAEQLASTGQATTARLGVLLDTRDPVRGALVTEVIGGAAADAAGIPEGAIITRLDDRIITGAAGLIAAVRAQAPGDTVTITWTDSPGGEERTVEVELGAEEATR